jgi:FkbM family methyltransferase
MLAAPVEPEPEPEPQPAPGQSVERPSAADVLEKMFGDHAVGDFFFVQVGANVGDTPQDPLYRSVLKYGWHGLLVEPLTHAMEQLRSNYEGCDGLIFEQCAISDAAGDRTLHFPNEADGAFRSLNDDMQTIAKGTASFDADHTNKVCKVQGHRIAMSHEVCRCSTMADVLDSRQVAPEAVRLLVVDTEGHDHVILNSLDYTVRSQHPALHPVPVASPARPNGVVVPHRCFGRRRSCLNTVTPMAPGLSQCVQERTSARSTIPFMTLGNFLSVVTLLRSTIQNNGVCGSSACTLLAPAYRFWCCMHDDNHLWSLVSPFC